MSKHVSEWLNAYHDGELSGSRLHQVELHLSECELCQAEMESLDDLSSLLHEVPTPEFVPSERFAAQVNLRLPHKQIVISKKKILEAGWWMIPVAILSSWIFVSTASLLGDILSVAGNLGLLSGMSVWLASGPVNDIYFSTTIGQMGLLGGTGLSWAEASETLARISLPLIGLQVSIALLYLSWMAIWWVRHTRRRYGPVLEG